MRGTGDRYDVQSSKVNILISGVLIGYQSRYQLQVLVILKRFKNKIITV